MSRFECEILFDLNDTRLYRDACCRNTSCNSMYPTLRSHSQKEASRTTIQHRSSHGTPQKVAKTHKKDAGNKKNKPKSLDFPKESCKFVA